MNSFTGMKRIYFFVFITIVVIFSANIYYYLKIYQQQISIEESFLLKQARITGTQIEKTGYQFENDLSHILFSDSISSFFSNEAVKEHTINDLKAFFFRYSSIISSIQYYDNNKHVFSLVRDRKNKFIMDIFASHVQQELLEKETLKSQNGEYLYHMPVLKNGKTAGNMVIVIDYLRYIKSVLTKLSAEDEQWQWIIDTKGEIQSFSLPGEEQIKISRLNKITDDVLNDNPNVLSHKVTINKKEIEIISAYYPTQIIKQKFGIVFSLQTDTISHAIINNSIAIAALTLLLILIISGIFIHYIKTNKREEKSLRKSEDILSKIIDELSVGFILLDQNKNIKKINKIAHDLFPEDLKVKEGEKMGDWFFKSGYTGEHKKLGDYFFNDVLFIKNDKVETALLKKESSIEANGEKLFIVSLIDISSFEKTRKQNAVAVKTKSELLTRMSQEIQIPVQGILSMLDEFSVKNLSDKQKEIFHSIKKISELLLSIIDDISSFSKLEADDLVIEEIPFSLKTELDDALISLRAKAEKKNLDFKLSIDKDITDKLIGDPFKFKQIIAQLTENAIKFTSKGQIRIKVSQLENTAGQITLQIIIEDTGIGIPKEDLKNIFGKSVSQNETITRKFAGAGLGAALSKQLVELLKGEIKAESPSGLTGDPEWPGSRFILTLDFYSNEGIQKDFSRDEITSYSHINALIIKDNDIKGQRIQEIMNNFGINVKMNFYHEKTLSLLESNLKSGKEVPHLLILRDSSNFNAFDFAKDLKERDLIQKFLVIIASSNDVKGNYVSARKLGVDYYLIEPCQGSELFNILQDNFPKIKISLQKEIKLKKLKKDIKILVAEDNLINQKTAQVIFKNLGYEIDIAANGLEAFKMAKANPYEIIFMDIMMPEMDGWEATKKIRDHGVQIPIIALTADFSDEAREKAREEELQDFIAKPIKIDDVKSVLIKWFTE